MNGAPYIWVLLDDKAGHQNQALGVAEALNAPFEIKTLSYSPLAHLPNRLLGASRWGLNRAMTDTLAEPWPDLIIAAGRRTVPVARWIRKQSKNEAKLCQIMWPEAGIDEFELIAAPKHDQKNGNNVMATLGAPHRITNDTIALAQQQWQSKLGNPVSPTLAVLVGGSTKSGAFGETETTQLVSMIEQWKKETSGSIFITVSRRTPKTLTDRLKSISGVHYFYDGTGENPYSAFLGMADLILVTGDSISMCSEACATGKAVTIFAPEHLLSLKHQRFVKQLDVEGYAAASTTTINTATPNKTPLLESTNIAEKIKSWF